MTPRPRWDLGARISALGKSSCVSTAIGAGVLIVLFTIHLVPSTWTGNEIGYFDLAHRWVNPDAFGDLHAAKDASIARLLSFLVMGAGVLILGMEPAFAAFGLAALVATPLSFVWLARRMRVDLLAAALALIVFFAFGQSLVGAAFMFGTVEPKTFAYILVMIGLGLAFSDRRVAAMGVGSAATYFHFLIGGFWAVAMLGLFVLKDQNMRSCGRMLGILVAATLPLLVAIIWERSGVPPDSSQFALNTIYAEYRVPHHIAPFVQARTFYADWLGGLVLHAVLAATFTVQACRSGAAARPISIWIAGLNGYILGAALIAFLDRNTHTLSILYLFRPSGLILLLTLLSASKWAIHAAGPALRGISQIALIAWLSVHFGLFSYAASYLFRGHQPLVAMLTPTEADMVEWVKAHTSPDAVVVIEPLSEQRFLGEGDGVWAGMERLLNRPTLVNFKFNPTDKSDLHRWYILLQWRQALFSGECALIHAQPVDYLIVRQAETEARLTACTKSVWRGDGLSILRPYPDAAL
ncbi:MAG: hypothetical protein AAF437_10485 [Pseudomonadota bacterium]